MLQASARSSSRGPAPSRTPASSCSSSRGAACSRPSEETDEFQAIEVAAADALYQKALALCKTYHVASERAVP
jgi:hypothetical protein